MTSSAPTVQYWRAKSEVMMLIYKQAPTSTHRASTDPQSSHA
jgi:hypothetical protein